MEAGSIESVNMMDCSVHWVRLALRLLIRFRTEVLILHSVTRWIWYFHYHLKEAWSSPFWRWVCCRVSAVWTEMFISFCNEFLGWWCYWIILFNECKVASCKQWSKIDSYVGVQLSAVVCQWRSIFSIFDSKAAPYIVQKHCDIVGSSSFVLGDISDCTQSGPKVLKWLRGWIYWVLSFDKSASYERGIGEGQTRPILFNVPPPSVAIEGKSFGLSVQTCH